MTPQKGEAPRDGGADADNTKTDNSKTVEGLKQILALPGDEVAELLASTRRYRAAARAIADDPATRLREKCLALLELNRLARQELLAEFATAAVWGGARALFLEPAVPQDTIGALRRLLRRGLHACPTCRRDLPHRDELERWAELEIESWRKVS